MGGTGGGASPLCSVPPVDNQGRRQVKQDAQDRGEVGGGACAHLITAFTNPIFLFLHLSSCLLFCLFFRCCIRRGLDKKLALDAQNMWIFINLQRKPEEIRLDFKKVLERVRKGDILAYDIYLLLL